jgi:REP element-mobilizing transposase RayT
VFCGQLNCHIAELNVQSDHVHFIGEGGTKDLDIEADWGVIGASALRVFTKLSDLRKKL